MLKQTVSINLMDLDEAIKFFTEALARNPGDVEARGNRGTAKRLQGHFAEAIKDLDLALKLSPTHTEFLASKGAALASLRRPKDAMICFDAALATNPGSALSWYERGVALLALERADEALKNFDRAIKLAPTHALSWLRRGDAIRAVGRLADALASYDRSLSLDAPSAEAHFSCGSVLLELNRPAEALFSFDQTLLIDASLAPAHNNRGLALEKLQRKTEALASYEQALRSRPNYAEAHNNRGNVLRIFERYEESLQALDLAIALRPNFVIAHNNRGLTLRAMNCPTQALAAFDRALEIDPTCAPAISNRGVELQCMHLLDEAIDCQTRAIALQPNFTGAHFNESIHRLLKGDLLSGFEKYEWRWTQDWATKNPVVAHKPLWLGKENIAGKTIYLHAEQGAGDTIQFCRYAKDVAARGARVILEVAPHLKDLLENLDGIDQLISTRKAVPYFDFHCPLLSLPLAFKADLSNISGEPYLQSETATIQRWRSKIGLSQQRRIGVAWRGRAEHKKDHQRSISFSQFRQIFDISSAFEFICLQNEIIAAEQNAVASESHLRSFLPDIDSFADTAAMISLMDIVITVDTSIAHLAGALGKEVWILLPFTPDWRWMLDRSDTPWYRSAELIRQPKPSDWESVLAAVKDRLSRRLVS
jgi:tetratricopeptide (TPR) repeat protein